jgi:hypothetical protein
MHKKATFLSLVGLLPVVIAFIVWAKQTLPLVALVGRIDFTKSKTASDGLLLSSEDGVLGGSRGELIQCSAQQECFALGLINGRETVFIAKAGRVNRVILQKKTDESNSRAFGISDDGEYLWTTNSGVITSRKGQPARLIPNTAKITVYQRNGSIKQQWQIQTELGLRRIESLDKKSLVVLGNRDNLYVYQIGRPEPQMYPHGKLLNASAVLGVDGFIWSPGERTADQSISLLGISMFSSAISTPVKVEFPSQKSWKVPIQSNRNLGVFVGDGGTVRHMEVGLLRPNGKYENVLDLHSNHILGFSPPEQAQRIVKYIRAGNNYAIVETKLKDQKGRNSEYFILKVTAIPRWRSWLS